ncbi:MAG: hypothetical protein H6721_16395 [Sandaracinus sp.]|nr:hypothetical protein [Sandaracinus sp.]MCB9623215.1 hypothetical protein [Sandaracinus sp.]MCB9633699.1 hypothetical protein [Sandaracinus sp.]
MPRALLPFAVVTLVACGGGADTAEPEEAAATGQEQTEPEAAPAGRVVDGYYVAAGAPDPLSCASDDECVASGVLDTNGCCWSFRDMNAVVQSTAYRDWTSGRRAACDVTRCPSPPAPTQPPDCLFEVRCAEGRCANACR